MLVDFSQVPHLDGLPITFLTVLILTDNYITADLIQFSRVLQNMIIFFSTPLNYKDDLLSVLALRYRKGSGEANFPKGLSKNNFTILLRIIYCGLFVRFYIGTHTLKHERSLNVNIIHEIFL